MKMKVLTCLGIFVTVIAFGIYWFFVGEMKFFNFSNAGSDWANFGSYAGGIFAALAFLVVVHQNYERDKEQRKQDFERTFFMMLEHHNNQINFLIDKKMKNNDGNNISIVESLYQELIDYPEGDKDYDIRERSEIGDLRDIYVDINSYFLNLFRILKFLYEHKDFNLDKKYSSLLRSYVPKNLLIVLSYHLYKRNKSYDEYIKYINEFSFFEHMDLFILEIIFISKVTSFNQEDIYKLINSSKFIEPGVLDVQLSIFEKLYAGNSSIDYKKVKEIMEKRFSSNPLEVKSKTYSLNEKYFRNILFYTLVTFDENAFKGNFDYSKLMCVYKNYIDYLRFERNNPFSQESQ
ncbi:putative phage abortive infection protein [Glaesserella parasuis]|nr:putative phage abortive infection protein [Glaesserella parasuis]MDE3946709.1 putative phage abortive infection protein [Glaesserella parasuis]